MLSSTSKCHFVFQLAEKTLNRDPQNPVRMCVTQDAGNPISCWKLHRSPTSRGAGRLKTTPAHAIPACLASGIVVYGSIIAIAVGGGIGSLVRWLLSVYLDPKRPMLPLGTLASNLVASWVIGFTVLLFTHYYSESPRVLRMHQFARE
ncbi:CrcB family protein [Caballeronia insecticola]|uniref:CrcB family protein n=1 Tax=Caballeronia insecticola TaxID=758793 RepID=UPI001360B638|nr:CrcB family protein [Caballeronia insecticola]